MAQKKKWNKETIEQTIIDYILTKSEKEGKPSFPDNATLRMCDNLPNTYAIKKETGMYPTELFRYLYETGKIPFKYEPKRGWNSYISPRVSGIEREVQIATRNRRDQYFRNQLKHM